MQEETTPASAEEAMPPSAEAKSDAVEAEKDASPPQPEPAKRDAKFNLKGQVAQQSKTGAGFNQFDPVLTVTSFISRRFGLAGGLALVALLASTEGNEILKAVTDSGPKAGSGEVITTKSGLQYVDVLIESNGNTPQLGAVIGFDAKVSIGGNILFDSKAGDNPKPIAFKYGQRPFQNVVCEGVEEGLKDMRPGGKRKLLVPGKLAPSGVNVPDGVKLEYEIELKEVLPGYF
jgi:hypothetical protein